MHQQDRVSGYAWYVVGILLIAWTLAYVDRLAIALLIPSLKADLHLTDTQISLIQGMAFGVFFAIAGLPIGRLVDRANRRNIMAAGIAIWSIMTLLCGLATNFWELFFARVGVGVGEACLAPASYSLLSDYFPASKRGRAAGVMGSGQPIGNALSSAGSGYIVQTFAGTMIALPLIGHVAPWQFVFLVFGAPGLMVALLMFTVREPPRQEKVQDTGLAGESFRHLLTRNRRLFLPLYLGFAVQFIAGYAVISWAPVVLMRVNKVPPAQVGALFASTVFVGIAAHVIGGWLGDALLRRRPLDGRVHSIWFMLPPMVLVLAMFLIPAGTAVTFAMIATLIFLLGAFSAASYPMLTDLLPNEMRGVAISVYMLVANMFGLGLSPTLVALSTDYIFRDDMMLRQSIVLVALPCTIIAIILLRIAQRPYAAMRANLVDV